MNAMSRFLGCLIIVAVMLSLIGCSGGSSGGPVLDAPSAARAQVAAALFVQQWAQIMWGMVTSQTTTGTPVFGPPVQNPDGSVSQTFTGTDGTVVVITQFLQGPDAGTVRLDITYPGGGTQTVEQGVPEFAGTITTIHWHITTPEGLDTQYTSVVDDKGNFNSKDDETDLTGTSTLPDGHTQTFDARSVPGESTIHSEQSDGSTFDMNVPLKRTSVQPPDMSVPSTGSYDIADQHMTFTLASTEAAPKHWAAMDSDFGGGVTGAFALNGDFSGSGELQRDGALAGNLSWDRAGVMSLTLVSAEQAQVNPAGAAVDYLVHRWQTLTALLAPAPGISAAGYPCILTEANRARH